MAGRDRKRRGFTSRTKQRNRALDVIFEADEKSLLDEDSLRALLAQRQVVSTAQVPIGEFGSRIVEAYAGNIDDVDTIVEASSEDWAMSRMNAVDRSILRAGTAELLYIGTERGQLIPEWASLAREFSTDRSVGFVMGILNRVADIRERETSQSDSSADAETPSDAGVPSEAESFEGAEAPEESGRGRAADGEQAPPDGESASRAPDAGENAGESDSASRPDETVRPAEEASAACGEDSAALALPGGAGDGASGE